MHVMQGSSFPLKMGYSRFILTFQYLEFNGGTWRPFHRVSRNIALLAESVTLCGKASGFFPLRLETSKTVQTDLACFRKISSFFHSSVGAHYSASERNGFLRALELHKIKWNSFYSEPGSSSYCRFTIHPRVRSVLFVEDSNQIRRLCQCGTI